MASDNFIYGKLNKEVEKVEYESSSNLSDPVKIRVDQRDQTIRAELDYEELDYSKFNYTAGQSTNAEVIIDNENRTISVNAQGGGQDVNVESTDSISMEMTSGVISSKIEVNNVRQNYFHHESKINRVKFTLGNSFESNIRMMLALSGGNVFTPLTYCIIDGQEAGVEFSKNNNSYAIRVATYRMAIAGYYEYDTVYTSETGWNTSKVDIDASVYIGRYSSILSQDAVDIISVVTQAQNPFFWMVCDLETYSKFGLFIPFIDIDNSNKIYRDGLLCYDNVLLYSEQLPTESQKQTVQKNLGLERDIVVTEGSNNLITSGAVFNYAKSYQAQDTDTIDTTIDNSTISSNLKINKESFNVGQVVDSLWFDTSLSAEELGSKIMSLFSEYDLSQSFTREKTAIIGTYLTEEQIDVLWFDWEHNVISEEPSPIGNGTFSIYVRQQGTDTTKVVEITYSWEYYGGEYIFTYYENDNPHWYSVVVNQEVEMIIQPTIVYVDSETGYLWNGEFIKNLVEMLLMGVSNGKVYNSNINKNSVLTTEKQYLTAEQQAQVLENLGLVNAQNRYY